MKKLLLTATVAVCMPATSKVPVVEPPEWLADPFAAPMAAE